MSLCCPHSCTHRGRSVLPQIISMQLHMQLFITLPLYAILEIKRTLPNIKYILSCVVKMTTNLVPMHQLLSQVWLKKISFLE